jgi:trans-aconitate methyltransferase
VAFDASAEMVRLARERVGSRAEVRHMRFEDVAWREEFDGIWTCASLLHVPAAESPSVAKRLASALRPRGAWYMSFKLGRGERVAGRRKFTNHTAETLQTALAGVPVQPLESWTSKDVRSGRTGEEWINTIVRRQ